MYVLSLTVAIVSDMCGFSREEKEREQRLQKDNERIEKLKKSQQEEHRKKEEEKRRKAEEKAAKQKSLKETKGEQCTMISSEFSKLRYAFLFSWSSLKICMISSCYMIRDCLPCIAFPQRREIQLKQIKKCFESLKL